LTRAPRAALDRSYTARVHQRRSGEDWPRSRRARPTARARGRTGCRARRASRGRRCPASASHLLPWWRWSTWTLQSIAEDRASSRGAASGWRRAGRRLEARRGFSARRCTSRSPPG